MIDRPENDGRAVDLAMAITTLGSVDERRLDQSGWFDASEPVFTELL